MSGVYGKCDDAESIAVDPPRPRPGRRTSWTPPTCTAGATTRSCSAGPSGAGATGWCWPPSSANCGSPDGADGVDGSPTTCRRPARPASSGWASTVSISTTSTGWTPACPSRTRSARWPAWSSRARCGYLGLSEAAPGHLRRAHAVHPIAALQTEFSLLYRQEAEETLRGLPRARHRVRRLLAARPKPPDRRASSTRRDRRRTTADGITRASRKRISPQNRALVRAVRAMPKRKAAPRRQLALAWLLARGRGHRADPGHQAEGRLDENAAAAACR